MDSCFLLKFTLQHLMIFLLLNSLNADNLCHHLSPIITPYSLIFTKPSIENVLKVSSLTP